MLSTKKTNNSDFAKRFKKIRKMHHMSQAVFGAKLGCGGDNISKIELGQSDPSPAVLLNFYREFGVREEWLTTGEGTIYKEGGDSSGRVAEKPDIYAGLSKRDREAVKIYEEIVEYNDPEIMGHLNRQLVLLKELQDRRKKERGQ